MIDFCMLFTYMEIKFSLVILRVYWTHLVSSCNYHDEVAFYDSEHIHMSKSCVIACQLVAELPITCLVNKVNAGLLFIGPCQSLDKDYQLKPRLKLYCKYNSWKDRVARWILLMQRWNCTQWMHFTCNCTNIFQRIQK